MGNVVADSAGNLFGTTPTTIFELAKTADGYAPTGIILHSFTGSPDGDFASGLMLDADANIFGTTRAGGLQDAGTLYEISKTANNGYANNFNILYNFCSQTNCIDGSAPSGLIADASGNLFGTTSGGAHDHGTVFQVSGSGFVPFFSGQPGEPSCIGDTNKALIGRYATLPAAAFVLHYPNVPTLTTAIRNYCAG